MIVFDTETTGLLAPGAAPLSDQPYIIEVAAIKLSDDYATELDRLTYLVRPPIPISEEISKITGITTADVEAHEPFAWNVGKLARFFLNESRIIGHNVEYDMTVLEYELARINRVTRFPWPSVRLCTAEITRGMEGVRKGSSGRFSLSELYEHLTGEKMPKAHRAMADVEALVQCCRHLEAKGML